MNDRMADVYPFVPGSQPPFSLGCIADLKVCLRMKTPQAVEVVRMTSIQITDDRITAALCSWQDTFLCQVEALADTTTVVHAESDVAEVTAVLTTGEILPTDRGSYVVDLVLEPACVCIMPAGVYSNTEFVRVNGVPMELDEMLYLRTEGYFKTTLTPPARPDGPYTLRLFADVPDTAVMTLQDTSSRYSMVTQINEVVAAKPEGTKLVIDIDCKDANGTSSGILGYKLTGDLESDESDMAVAGHGTYVYLTLYGTHLVPNCYSADEDEASELEV